MQIYFSFHLNESKDEMIKCYVVQECSYNKKSADWKHGLFLFSCKWLLPCGSYSTMTGGTVEIPVGWISIINTLPTAEQVHFMFIQVY